MNKITEELLAELNTIQEISQKGEMLTDDQKVTLLLASLLEEEGRGQNKNKESGEAGKG